LGILLNVLKDLLLKIPYVFSILTSQLHLSYETQRACFQIETPIRDIPILSQKIYDIQEKSSFIISQHQARQSPLECSENAKERSFSKFFSAPEQYFDNSDENETDQSISQLKNEGFLDSLPDFQNSNPILSNPCDEIEAAPADQPRRPKKQAFSSKSQIAEKVLRTVLLRRAPEEIAPDSGGSQCLNSCFLDSLPLRPRPQQRRRSAFAQTRPTERGSSVSEPNPVSDSALHPLHPEAENSLRQFGLLPPDQGETFTFNPELVFPDPILMTQPGDNPYKTIDFFKFLSKIIYYF
jgi:hypothetical protein